MSESNNDHELIQNKGVTWEGCSVLLDINDGDRLVFARLTAGATIKVGKKNDHCSLRPLIGCPFGSMFDVENGSDGKFLTRAVSSSSEVFVSGNNNNDQDEGDFPTKGESRDNRALVDNNTAQSLTGEDIEKMRRQGATGAAIVQALISNSATYDNKTPFSQEKYKLKKLKKFAPKVLLRRPTARSICDTYFKKYPETTGFLRIDTLSLLLSMANITSNSDVLVVDMLGGILTGAVAERLGGMGYVCNAYMGDKQHSMNIVRIFNFNDETCRRIVRCSLTDLCLTPNGNSNHVHEDCNVTDNKSIEQEPFPSSIPVSMEGISVTSENGIENPLIHTKTGSQINKTIKSAKAGDKASQELLKQWKENGFSSLLIAAPEQDAWSIVKEVFPLLSYSASFVIYHQYLQPLATCMHNLLQEKMAICLQISEPWLREYQVLPSRTHPCMQMSASGGYILTGTKICSSVIHPQVKNLLRS